MGDSKVRRDRSGPGFDVSIEHDDRTVTVRCSGDLDVSTSETLATALAACLDGGQRSVVVDCRDVPFVDSSGVRALLRFRKRCAADGVDIVIFASEQLRTISGTLGLEEALAIRAADGTE